MAQQKLNPSTNMKGQLIAVRDTELYVEGPPALAEDWQQSEPSIMLLHGLTSSCGLNDRLAFPDWLRLKEYFPLYRYDARGHGRSGSEGEPANFTWQNLALDLIALVESLGLIGSDKKLVPVGSSMGAATILCALVAGLEVDRAVLVIPPTIGEARKQTGRVYSKFADILEKGGSSALVKHWRSLPPTPFTARECPEHREISYRELEASANSKSLAAAFRGAALNEFPHEAALKQIKCPVLILSRIDDPTHPVEAAEYLSSVLENSVHYTAKKASDVHEWPLRVHEFISA